MRQNWIVGSKITRQLEVKITLFSKRKTFERCGKSTLALGFAYCLERLFNCEKILRLTANRDNLKWFLVILVPCIFIDIRVRSNILLAIERTDGLNGR